MSSATPSGGGATDYTYNAFGQRASKSYSGSNAVYYYHDAFGNLGMSKSGSHVMEYPLPGRFGKYYWNASNWETDYAHKNPLGSTQLVTRADGSYAQAEIFFPFGGVRWSGGGTPDVRFASMPERDVETQTWLDPLDPTLFRMYTSGQGRWLTPDPLGGDVTNPQSLNRYADVLDNPESLVDPLGLHHDVECGEVGNPRDCVVGDYLNEELCTDSGGCMYWDSFSNMWVQPPINTPQTDPLFDASNGGDGLASPGFGFGFDLGALQYRQYQGMRLVKGLTPTTCGGGAFGYAGFAPSHNGAAGFVGYLGEYDTKAGWSNFGLFEGGTKAVSGGVAANGHSFEPLIFLPVAEAGGVVLGASGSSFGVGFYLGAPRLGGGAYVNVTTMLSCEGQ